MVARLGKKRSLIVGGTGGIGLAAARRFLEEGARLVVAGLPGEDSAAAVASLRELGLCSFVACDARDGRQVEDLFAEAVRQLGGLDILYHVAGASGRRHGDGPLHVCSDEGWEATLAGNLTSTFRTNRAAVRQYLKQSSPGTILNMASVLAISPSPRYFDTCAYAAAKGAIIAMSRSAAARYAASGIRVNVIAPGLIDTPTSARAVSDPVIVRFLHNKQPLKPGPGQPDDCSDAAVFLCSDEARFVTGVVLPVDGGWCISDGPCEPS
jgi:NAD(P)-dependent dehydrogenase (short-subunit alcohol dehydrogenase family)